MLFVDDDPAIVDAATILLEAARMQVETALNGDDALAHIAAGVLPDIVVTDYRLPHYTGVEAVQRIRQQTVDE